MKRFWAIAAIAGLLLGLAGAFSATQAGAGATVPGSLFQPNSIERPLHQADMFRQCQQISSCGLDRHGNRRCGLVWKCRQCQFVRMCTRAAGCNWQEKCVWGPYAPPLKQ